jgi:hypothetical protein
MTQPDPGPETLTRLPDTPLVREAQALLERAASRSLIDHSVRSFLFGRAYGRKHGIDCDEEDLLLAALFHDLGLCPDHRDPSVPFTIAGSRALRAFLAERGAAPGRIEPLVDAIDFHMQMRPRWASGPAAGLLQVGAWMDITGLRRRGMRDDARVIESAYPRDDIRTRFYGLLFGSFGSVGACIGTLFPGRYRA